MKKSIVGLLVLGGLISGGLVPQTAQAAKSYRLNWMHAWARNTFKFRKSGYKHYAYTLHKVKHNRYRLKRAYRLGTKKNKVVHQIKAMSLGNYEYVYVTYKGKGVWVNEKYLVYSRPKKATKKRSTNTTNSVQPTRKSATTRSTGSTAEAAQTTPAVTSGKGQSSKSQTTPATTSTSTKFYIKTNKHISWQEWLSLPDLKGQVNGLTFYHVDNVPYDEDGFPYVTQNMFSAPLQVRMMKSEFTAATYQAISDKWDTYYVSEKHALFCPTNTEVGQAIRDQMPD